MIKYQFILQKINIQISQVFLIFQNFGVSEVFELFRLLQTVLFLTDSVFFALCACFDDSMVFFEEFLP